MRKCCICLPSDPKVTPIVSLRRPSTSQSRRRKNELSATIFGDDPVVIESLNGVLMGTHGQASSNSAPSRPKPKVYSASGRSFCKTPSVELSHSTPLKYSKLYRKQSRVPRSAMILPDAEAKKTLMQLQIYRSRTVI